MGVWVCVYVCVCGGGGSYLRRAAGNGDFGLWLRGGCFAAVAVLCGGIGQLDIGHQYANLVAQNVGRTCRDGCVDGWMDERMDESVGGCVGGWVDQSERKRKGIREGQ